MPKHYIKYKNHGPHIPWYVEDAGLLEIEGWYYGISKDDAHCYIPTDIERVDLTKIKTEFGKIEYKKSQSDQMKTYSKAEKDALVDLIFTGKI